MWGAASRHLLGGGGFQPALPASSPRWRWHGAPCPCEMASPRGEVLPLGFVTCSHGAEQALQTTFLKAGLRQARSPLILVELHSGWVMQFLPWEVLGSFWSDGIAGLVQAGCHRLGSRCRIAAGADKPTTKGRGAPRGCEAALQAGRGAEQVRHCCSPADVSGRSVFGSRSRGVRKVTVMTAVGFSLTWAPCQGSAHEQ